ncbi:dehydrogenase/reductase SDR family member 11-like [Onthophagus taurus]|uniref:dehydrogenase/reductase SDR family member 11-like n=1 Tax=Onthophagus taurus TaxID=166361 RepID=UPI0039BDFC9E
MCSDIECFGEKLFEYRTHRWMGSTAIITGASSGIGEAIGETLLKLKINVVGIGRNLAILKEIEKRHLLDSALGKLFPFECDLKNEKRLIEIFEYVNTNLGGVSVLVNAAGILLPTTLIDGSTEMWQEMMEINVISLGICINEAVKSMIKNNIDGCIININCYCGHEVPNIPFPSYNFYSGTKFGVTALNETVRRELKHLGLKIKTSMISPDVVNTELNHNLLDIADTKKLLTKGPTLNPEDVADACLFILGAPPNVGIDDIKLRAI